MLDRNQEALVSFDEVLRLNPNDYEAWYFRGNILSKLSRYDEAIVSYKQVTKIRPDYQEAWFLQGWMLLSKWGNFQDTLTKYSLALIVIDTVPAELMTSVEQAFNCFHPFFSQDRVLVKQAATKTALYNQNLFNVHYK